MDPGTPPATIEARVEAPAAPGAPTPVLELARLDLAATRASRLSMVAALSGPGMLLVGAIAQDSFAGLDRTDPARYAGAGFVTVGLGATGLGPPALLLSAHVSATALRRQGLHAPSTAALLGLPMYTGAAATVVYIAVRHEERPEAFEAPEALVTFFYGGAVALGALQLRTNHLARRDAGWLGVGPSSDGRGLAVAGRW